MAIDTLIVDDDQLTLFLHQVFVKENKFNEELLVFSSGKEFIDHLDKVQEETKDTCVFLDLNMPGLSGWEVVELIQEKPYQERLKIVILTSSVNKSDRSKADEYPQVVTFMEKPLTDAKVQELKENAVFKKYF